MEEIRDGGCGTNASKVAAFYQLRSLIISNILAFYWRSVSNKEEIACNARTREKEMSCSLFTLSVGDASRVGIA